MLLRKWNYKEHKYEPYEIPDEWKCRIDVGDMEEIINCSHCGKKIKWGDSYNSMEIHTNVGFGYRVCEKCYQNEWIRRDCNDT